MNEPAATTTGLRGRAAAIGRRYAPRENRPLTGYLASMAVFTAAAATFAGLVRATGRSLPHRPAPADIALVSIATHKLSRLLTKEAVTSPLRAPFTRYQGPAGNAELHEEVRGDGGTTRHAVGELVSCPFCMSVWVAGALTGGLVLAPRATRLAATALTAVTVSDFLQFAYAGVRRGEQRPPARHEQVDPALSGA
ncbi:DUF1360 domain-containing protein [Phytohabitans kaempferiae]|uniref:DUF1360 domain-containing protein n=1 Tax=Phytohabitans kaempferiae TaxID=1620943 RepID=A0ABV6MAD9_9ACTN